MIAGILPGHGSREPGRYDPGARAPASHAHPNGWTEADLVRAVGLACCAAAQGCAFASEGTYRERGRRLAQVVPGAPVLQLHADAVAADTGPDRTTLWTYPGNTDALALAQVLREEIGPVVPWPVAIHVADRSVAWHAGVLTCLSAVAQSSVLIEVGYTDGVIGREALPGLAPAIGRAIAAALACYRATTAPVSGLFLGASL